MIDEKDDTIQRLDDGAIVKDGRVLTDEEAEAEDSETILLADVLKVSAEIARPSVHSPAVQAILDCTDEPEDKRQARESRLAKINEMLSQDSKEQTGNEEEER